ILLGYSGHGYVVLEAAMGAGLSIDYYADKKEANVNPFHLDYIGFEGNENFEGWNKGYGFILGIGDNKIRAKLGQLLVEKNESIVDVRHPSAVVSKSSTIGSGTFISAHATVNALSQIGKYVILNTNSIVEHECKIA